MSAHQLNKDLDELDRLLSEDVKFTLELPRNTQLTLAGHTIVTLGQAVRYSTREYRRWNSRRKKTFSYLALKRALGEHGLRPGMKVPMGPLEKERLYKLSIIPFSLGTSEELKEIKILTLGDFVRADSTRVIGHLVAKRSYVDAVDLYVSIRSVIAEKAIPI